MGDYLCNWVGCACRDVDSSQQVTSIRKKRGCTDVPCLLMFVALLVVVVVFFADAKSRGGDPDKLIRGVDINNHICGVHASVKDTPLAAWVDMQEYMVKLCVASCGETTTDVAFLAGNPAMRETAIQMQSVVTGTDNSTLVPFGYETFKFLHYCLPDLNAPSVSIDIEGFGTASEITSRAIGDLSTSWEILLVGIGIAVVLSFVYGIMLRCFAGVFVWLSIAGVVLGAAFMGYTFLEWAKDAENTGSTTNRVSVLKGFGYGCIVIAVLFVLIVLFLRKRIKIAVEVVKEASRSLGDVWGVYLFPFFPFVVAMGIVVLWLYSSLYIFSVTVDTAMDVPSSIQNNPMAFNAFQNYRSRANDSTPLTQFIEAEWDQSLKGVFAAHFFFLLWAVQFVIYFTYFVVAGCVADWYFTERDDRGNKLRGSADNELGRFPVLSSCWRTLRYHLGTVCYGAAIIAIIQFIRAMIKYLEQQSKAQNNQLQKALFCAIQCCLKCVQCCMDFISKNSFVFTAVYGTSFCTSAYNSFQLIWRNLARVAAISLVGNFLMIIGKALVSFLTAGICGYILYTQEPWKSDVSSPVAPVVVIFIMAYMVSSLFLVIFETSIDTIFLCFLIDEEANKGGAMLASESLRNIVGKYAQQSQEKAAEMSTLSHG